jgi:hypothetical protein
MASHLWLEAARKVIRKLKLTKQPTEQKLRENRIGARDEAGILVASRLDAESRAVTDP